MELHIKCLNYKIAADWLEGRDAKNIIIILPGYSSSKARQRIHAEAMVKFTGMSALVVDFSGHGNSPFDLRETSPAQHLLELIYVFDWLKQKYPDSDVSVSGGSYGGYLAAQLTNYREFAKLILRAPAIYEPTTFYDLWSKRSDNADQYDSQKSAYRHNAEALANNPLLARAKAFKGRVLVVVHENDEEIPRQTTDAYIKAFNANSFIAEGFKHSINAHNQSPEILAVYQRNIADWLNG